MGASVAPKRGRPSEFDPVLADIICERMKAGESLRAICRDEGMPAEGTVRTWAVANQGGFHAQYTRAREAQMDALAEDIIEIADDKEEDPQRARLRVDTRKWLMSKIAPKRFGDRTRHELTGAGGGPVAIAAIDPAKLSQLSEQELDVLERAYATLGISGGDPGGEGEAEGAGGA